MRILITGATGFLGGRLAKYFDQEEYEIRLGFRQKPGTLDVVNGHWIRLDWQSTEALEDVCTNIDVLIHAAGINAKDCTLDPVTALEFNGLGTARLVSAACRSKVKQIIYLSTAHVYSDPLEGVVTEDVTPRNFNPYATSHLAGEAAVLGAGQKGDAQATVLRLSNAFGAPAQKNSTSWNLLINDLCRQAVETNEIVLKTSGLQVRDFIPTTLVCNVIGHLVRIGPNPQIKHKILNLGSGKSRTIREVAKIIQKRFFERLDTNPNVRWNRADLSLGNKFVYTTMDGEYTHLDPDDRMFHEELDQLIDYCCGEQCSLFTNLPYGP